MNTLKTFNAILEGIAAVGSLIFALILEGQDPGVAFAVSVGVLPLFLLPVSIMFILHIVAISLSHSNGGTKRGSAFGIVATAAAIVPGLSVVLHAVSSIFLFREVKEAKKAIQTGSAGMST
jgi:hypothetical protein